MIPLCPVCNHLACICVVTEIHTEHPKPPRRIALRHRLALARHGYSVVIFTRAGCLEQWTRLMREAE